MRLNSSQYYDLAESPHDAWLSGTNHLRQSCRDLGQADSVLLTNLSHKTAHYLEAVPSRPKGDRYSYDYQFT